MASSGKQEETTTGGDELTITSTITLNDGRAMPVFGLGVWRAKPKDCKRAVLAALEAGYRHIDTAHLYANEADVGAAVRESGVPREQVWVTTKVWTDELGEDITATAAQQCLDRLGLDYVDLLLIHAPGDGYVGAWKAMEKLQQSGKAKSIGVSNFGTQHMERLAKECTVVPAVNQVELHPMLQQKKVVEYCVAKGIAITGYAPLIRASQFDNPSIKQVSKNTGKTGAQVLVRWALQKGYISIPKSTNKGRIIENAGVFGWKLSDGDMAKLDALDADHHECWDPLTWDA